MAVVTVTQLTSTPDGKSFLNVAEKYGFVCADAHIWRNPTFIIKYKNHSTVRFIQFDDDEWATEHLAAHTKEIEWFHQFVYDGENCVYLSEQDIGDWI